MPRDSLTGWLWCALCSIASGIVLMALTPPEYDDHRPLKRKRRWL